jgi:hypothetical protein
MSIPQIKSLFKFDKLVLLLTLILLSIIALRVIWIIWISYKAQWILGLLTLALVAFSSLVFTRMRASDSTLPYLLVIVGIFLALRIYWIWQIPTPLFSDFESYHRLANFFQAGNVAKNDLGWYYFTYSLGYPLVLSIWYSIAGNSLLFAKLFNVLLGLVTLFLLYRLGGLKDRRLGLITAFLFAIWPAQVAFTNNIASEHLAMLLFIAALFLFIRFTSSDAFMKDGILLGILLSAVYFTRGALIIVLLIILGFLILGSFPIKQKMMRVGVVLLGFSCFSIFFLLLMSLVYGVKVKSQGFSTLLMGTNFNSQGMWNPEDGIKYISFDSPEEANRYALDESIARIRSAPRGFVKLMGKKIFILWEDENYGVSWSTSQIEYFPQTQLQSISAQAAAITADFFHFIVIILAMITLFAEGRSSHVSKQIVFLALLLLSGTFLHTIVESQPRYHYWMEAILIYLSALTLLTLARGKVQVSGSAPRHQSLSL